MKEGRLRPKPRPVRDRVLESCDDKDRGFLGAGHCSPPTCSRSGARKYLEAEGRRQDLAERCVLRRFNRATSRRRTVIRRRAIK